MKKGDTWISAVLYIALGTIVVTMLLAAGMPVINKIRDRNIILQTKEVMFGINNAIRTVTAEGPGSQRSITIEIGQGLLGVYDGENKINWTMESRVVVSEPGLTVNEGDLKITTLKSNKEDRYDILLALDYSGIADIKLTGDKIITGRRNIVVRNNGQNIIELRIDN